MLNLKHLSLILCFYSTSFSMLNKPSKTVELIKHNTELQSYIKLEIIIKKPELLKQQRTVDIILKTDLIALKKFVQREYLPEFTPIFIKQSSNEQFLKVIEGCDKLLQNPDVQKRFLTMPDKEIIKFLDKPENSKYLEFLHKQSPKNVQRLLNVYRNQFNLELHSNKDKKQIVTTLSKYNPWLIIKKSTYNIISKLNELCYGSKDVDSDTEKYIRDIANKYGISRDFKIKQINQKILEHADAKAFVVLDHLYIDAKAFNYLPEIYKEALVLHELYHIIAKHSYKEHIYISGNIAITAIAYSGIFNSIQNYSRSNSIIRSIAPTLTTYSGALALKRWLNERYQNLLHQNEYQADLFAANHLGKEKYIEALEYLTESSCDNLSTHPSLENRIKAIESLHIDSDIVFISQQPEFRVEFESNDLILSPYKIPLNELLRPVGYNPRLFFGNPALLESLKAAGTFVSNAVKSVCFTNTTGKALALEGSVYFGSFFNKLIGSSDKSVNREKLKKLEKLTDKYYQNGGLSLNDKQDLLLNFHECFKDISDGYRLFSMSPKEFEALCIVSNILQEKINNFDYRSFNNSLKTLEFASGIKKYGDLLGTVFIHSKPYRDLLQAADRISKRNMGLSFSTICDLSKKTGISIPELFNGNLNIKAQNLNKELIQILYKAWDKLPDPALFKESIQTGLEALKKGNFEKAQSILSLVNSKYADFIKDTTIWNSIYGIFFKSPKNPPKLPANSLTGGPSQGPGKDPKDKERFFEEKLKSKAIRTGRTPYGKIFKDPATELWWSKDKANHSGPHYKVFTEGARGLEWKFDADLLGEIIKDKHKGPIGRFISYKDIIFQ